MATAAKTDGSMEQAGRFLSIISLVVHTCEWKDGDVLLWRVVPRKEF
jgi:hypothetical protein